MAMQFRLAALGHTMEKGRVVEWLVSEGAPVTEGEPLLTVETDKAAVDVDAPIDGILLKIVGQVDTDYPVGATLAWIGAAGEEIPDEEPAPAAAPEVVAPELRVTPVARRLAERHGIDADALQGTGPGGRVTKADVQQAVETGQPPADADGAAADRGELVPLTGIQRIAAERLSASWRDTPMVTEGIEVDFTACLAARTERKAAWAEAAGVAGADTVEPTINDIILKATATALRAHPRLNAAYTADGIRQFRQINLGVAIDVDGGLVVPVLRGADDLGLAGIAKAVRDLAEKARRHRLGLAELEGGTFTVTNLGGFGIDWFTPVLNPPQCAILGIGRVRRLPVVEGDAIVVRDRATFVLSFDHRVVDGVPCARFLGHLKELLENPEPWLG